MLIRILDLSIPNEKSVCTEQRVKKVLLKLLAAIPKVKKTICKHRRASAPGLRIRLSACPSASDLLSAWNLERLAPFFISHPTTGTSHVVTLLLFFCFHTLIYDAKSLKSKRESSQKVSKARRCIHCSINRASGVISSPRLSLNF